MAMPLIVLTARNLRAACGSGENRRLLPPANCAFNRPKPANFLEVRASDQAQRSPQTIAAINTIAVALTSHCISLPVSCRSVSVDQQCCDQPARGNIVNGD